MNHFAPAAFTATAPVSAYVRMTAVPTDLVLAFPGRGPGSADRSRATPLGAVCTAPEV